MLMQLDDGLMVKAGSRKIQEKENDINVAKNRYMQGQYTPYQYVAVLSHKMIVLADN